MICPKCGAQTTKTKSGPFYIITCEKCGLGSGSIASSCVDEIKKDAP